MKWQPIETAPKDRPILCFWPVYTYDVGDEVANVIAIARWKDNPRIHVGYFSDIDEWDDYGMPHNPPTHWMPLPEPPQ